MSGFYSMRNSSSNDRDGALAVIPAGGACALPGGWLTPLAGRPLLAHAIAAARKARAVTRVVVATGDGEIAAVAEGYGAEGVPCVAASEEEQLALDAVSSLARGGRLPAVTVVLSPAAPLIGGEDIDGAVALVAGGVDSAVAVTPFRGRLWRPHPGGAERIGRDPEAGDARYAEGGALYALQSEGFRTAGRFPFGTATLYVVPEERALLIGEAADLAIAEMFLVQRAGEERLARLPRRPAALVMDFDGVFTDNRVLVDQDGREAVLCNRSDGLGLEQLRASGLPMLVLSKEKNPVVGARCRKLHLECLQGIDDKRPALEAWCRERDLPLAEVVYVGNDTNDLPCFAAVGCPVAVADSHPEALAAASVVLALRGGHGALRELTDLLTERLRDA